MLMSTTAVIQIEEFGDAISAFGRLYCSFVFVLIKCTCMSCEIMLPVSSSEKECLRIM